MAEIKSQVKGPSLSCWKRDRTNTQQILSNVDLINQNLKNIILGNTKERIYNITYGADILKLLFSAVAIGVDSSIKSRIASLISQYEPRIRLIDLQIETKEDEFNSSAVAFYVKLVYTVSIEGDFNTYENVIPIDPREVYKQNSMFI